MVNPPERNFSTLTTDLYEVTMACGYWKAGVSDYEAAFHVTFRENPFGGQFTVACDQRPRYNYAGNTVERVTSLSTVC